MMETTLHVTPLPPYELADTLAAVTSEAPASNASAAAYLLPLLLLHLTSMLLLHLG